LKTGRVPAFVQPFRSPAPKAPLSPPPETARKRRGRQSGVLSDLEEFSLPIERPEIVVFELRHELGVAGEVANGPRKSGDFRVGLEIEWHGLAARSGAARGEGERDGGGDEHA
jgi:hypothetical protein